MTGSCELSNEYSGSIIEDSALFCMLQKLLGKLVKKRDGVCFVIPVVNHLGLLL
jgi:hypothetical protein